PVRFFFLDARAFIGVLFFLMHARLWVFILALVLLVVFWIFERKGLMFSSALRAIRCWFVGRWRPANKRTAIRRMVDYGSL
ncbi:MAG: IcmT/TraK family protein, partial [Alphaproteobacteria bacterium]|nr:IcmT/TraK family protein [Alphaproteobacteria bacterium]